MSHPKGGSYPMIILQTNDFFQKNIIYFTIFAQSNTTFF